MDVLTTVGEVNDTLPNVRFNTGFLAFPLPKLASLALGHQTLGEASSLGSPACTFLPIRHPRIVDIVASCTH